jgi:4,5:9,10-diseco-3-hydroxy-5,9,17-trioxoandrosta-1(10),2-diene-4-oate hydrolase
VKRLNLLENLISRIGVPVERKVVNAGTIKTNYLLAGKGQAVLLLHGASAGAVTWSPVIGPLSTYSQVIAPDVVGYGESDKPSASYDRTYFVSWLRDFLDTLGLQTVSIVGVSQGGSIAMQFALDNPERVDRLVLADSGSLGKEMPLGAKLGFMWSNTLPSSMAGKWLTRYLVHDPKSVDEIWAEYSCEVQRMPGGKRAFWQGLGKATAPIPIEQLGKISHQTLIIWGKEEKLFPLTHAEAAQRIMPNAQLYIIPEAGHVAFFDQSEIFNNVLKRFLT